MRLPVLLVVALSACTPEPEAVIEDPLPPLPEIEGLVPARDHDPAEDVVEIHLRASVASVAWLDGKQTEVWAYNDTVPGPLIQARVGDTVRVVFDNDLPEPTTIHWHGLRISDEMDGVPAIQAPVEPGESFTYTFVPPDAGTFWYHPHVRAHEQIERGLQGMFVVHEREPVEVATERAFVIDDALIDQNGDWYSFALETNHMLQMHGRLGNTLVVNGVADVLQGSVRPGVAERWRLVNTANARMMWVDVQGADWRVVGVDGGALARPYTTTRAELPIGRRYDLEVIPHADAERVQLRVLLPDGATWADYTVFDAVNEGEPGDGTPPDWQLAEPFELPETTQDVQLVLDVGGGGTAIDWTINGEVWADHTPIEVDGHTPTRIVVHDDSGLGHPFHLHGQFFRVLQRNGAPALDEPGWLDTVFVDGYDRVELFSDFDNPGRWMSHCHILEHAERGMMTEMIVSE